MACHDIHAADERTIRPMSFNFPAFLVLATVLTGGIWLLDALLFAPRRRRLAGAGVGAGATIGISGPVREPVVVEYARSFFPVILAVLLLRSFLVEPFRIPSGSMMPTLLVGDFILVNKFAYGLRLPVLDTKFVEVGDPARGDVAVFRFPKDPSTISSSAWSVSQGTVSSTATRPFS
jgi:signal peptidase I